MKRLLIGAICVAVAVASSAAQRVPVREQTLTDHKNGSAGLLFSRDGARLAVTSGSGAKRRISIWNAASGRLLATLNPGPRGVAVQFSPGGSYLATSTRNGNAAIWKTGSGKAVPPCCLESVLFGPDDQSALVRSRGVTRVVHLERRGEGKPVPISQAVGTGGTFLAVTGEGAVQAWQWSPLALRGQLGRLSGGSVIQRSDFSRDGCVVITSTASPPTEVQVWDVCRNRSLGIAKGDPFVSEQAALGRDGSLLLTTDGDLVRVYHIGSSTAPTAVKMGGTVAAVNSDASRLAVWTDDVLELREAVQGHLIAKLPRFEERPAVRFSPDSRWLVTVLEFESARLWDAQSGKKVAAFGTAGESRSVILAVFSPEGARLALALRDGTVELWSLKSLLP